MFLEIVFGINLELIVQKNITSCSLSLDLMLKYT